MVSQTKDALQPRWDPERYWNANEEALPDAADYPDAWLHAIRPRIIGLCKGTGIMNPVNQNQVVEPVLAQLRSEELIGDYAMALEIALQHLDEYHATGEAIKGARTAERVNAPRRNPPLGREAETVRLHEIARVVGMEGGVSLHNEATASRSEVVRVTDAEQLSLLAARANVGELKPGNVLDVDLLVSVKDGKLDIILPGRQSMIAYLKLRAQANRMSSSDCNIICRDHIISPSVPGWEVAKQKIEGLVAINPKRPIGRPKSQAEVEAETTRNIALSRVSSNLRLISASNGLTDETVQTHAAYDAVGDFEKAYDSLGMDALMQKLKDAMANSTNGGETETPVVEQPVSEPVIHNQKELVAWLIGEWKRIGVQPGTPQQQHIGIALAGKAIPDAIVAHGVVGTYQRLKLHIDGLSSQEQPIAFGYEPPMDDAPMGEPPMGENEPAPEPSVEDTLRGEVMALFNAARRKPGYQDATGDTNIKASLRAGKTPQQVKDAVRTWIAEQLMPEVPAVPQTPPKAAATPKTAPKKGLANLKIIQTPAVDDVAEFRPTSIVISGMPKFGKTTFAMTFPKPIMINLEDSAKDFAGCSYIEPDLDIQQAPKGQRMSGLVNWIEDALDELAADSAATFKSVVMDTADELWRLVSEAYMFDHGLDKLNPFDDYPVLYSNLMPIFRRFEMLSRASYYAVFVCHADDKDAEIGAKPVYRLTVPGKLNEFLRNIPKELLFMIPDGDEESDDTALSANRIYCHSHRRFPSGDRSKKLPKTLPATYGAVRSMFVGTDPEEHQPDVPVFEARAIRTKGQAIADTKKEKKAIAESRRSA